MDLRRCKRGVEFSNHLSVVSAAGQVPRCRYLSSVSVAVVGSSYCKLCGAVGPVSADANGS